ncbi:MAG: hypothetical protein SPL45_08390 [Schwartzia succinivorans]|nr:hypothetical protein [Schwartzia succinivorans]
MFDGACKVEGRKRIIIDLEKAKEWYWPEDIKNKQLPETMPDKEEVERMRLEYAALKGGIAQNTNDTMMACLLAVFVGIVSGVIGGLDNYGACFRNFIVVAFIVVFVIGCVGLVSKSFNANMLAVREQYYIDYFERIKLLGKSVGKDKDEAPAGTEEIVKE